MKNIKLNKYTNRAQLFEAVADTCEKQLAKTIENNDEASFVIPGGTTPAPAFKLLANSNLEWKKITIAQSDERWVEADHSHSNQRLTTENLLIDNASTANYLAMKNSAESCNQGEDYCDQAYKKMPSPFSVTMLGMGLDGHFASLFPGSKEIEEAMNPANKKLCMSIDATGCQVAGDYPHRMTLTLAGILNSQLIILLITGKEKLTVIQQAQQSNKPLKQPVAALLNQTETPVEIFWAE